MSRVPNVKLGGGSLKVGHSVFANQLKKWNGTGTAITYTDLVDRPDYYLREVAEYFGLSYDKRTIKKDDWYEVKDPKVVKNPAEGSPSLIYSDKLPRAAKFYVDYDKTYLNQFTDATYKLSFNHPEEGLKQSRSLKYYFTCEEIQTVINEDLISGYSGYSVSNAGDIEFGSFGPYMLQSNWTGLNTNPIYVSENSNKELISGFITGYHGGLNSHSHYTLNFAKTGSGIYTHTYSGTNFEPDTEIRVETVFQDYDVDAGSYMVDSATSIPLLVGVSGVDSSESIFHTTLTTSDSAGMITRPSAARVVQWTTGIDFVFSDEIDPNDSEKKIYITGALATPNPNVLRTLKITPYQAYELNLEVDGDGAYGYTKENYWYLGAPSGYLGHRHFHYSGIKITNSNEIKGFRIPYQNNPTVNDTLSRVVITNCPNFEHFRGHPMELKAIAHLDLSGCSLSTQNDLHGAHSSAFYSSTGEFPQNVYRTVPDYLRVPYYNGIEVDEAHDQAVPEGADPAPINSYLLKHINVAGNSLNQTGLYYWIRAANITFRKNGYLNISNQDPRVGPESPVFDGLRSNAHEEGFPDINNYCISGINELKKNGWTVIHDGSFDRLPE
tara:strand:+ start:658 stop:2484 length:1827 start_codon:yes stop_codon:yes gene_type:complete